MATVTERVFTNRDNKPSIIVSQNGIPFDFSTVTRIVLFLVEDSITVDSDISPTSIVWSAGNGKIDFDLSGLTPTAATQTARLVVYDPSHPNGQVFIHEDNAVNLSFKFFAV